MRNKFKPYIRRGNFRERADNFRIAMRLAFYKVTGKPYYVMVQRGFPNSALDAQDSRRTLQRSVLMVWADAMTFKRWAKTIMQQCQAGK